MKLNKGKVMLKRKRDGCLPLPEHNQNSEVVSKNDNADMDDDKKIRGETHIASNETPSQATKVSSRAIFILENASLKKGFVRKKSKLLNSEEDADFLLKQGKKLNDYRPDIVYEALKGILDSPLNKLGMVGAIYVRTDSGVLFEIKPHVRIPRTFKRFCGIILELLEKSCIRDKDTGDVLLRVLKEPVTRHLPEKARVIGLSYNSPKLVDLDSYVSVAADDASLVFVVGAMVHGEVGKDNCEDYISGELSMRQKWRNWKWRVQRENI
ncbi:uncharacterized protein [Euphorbia lathyris]|uniref:uncharacterized protein isoform X2 n=1 Tax=Euphorbia lathyris TaxID=212925 RepID=UPI0033132B2D